MLTTLAAIKARLQLETATVKYDALLEFTRAGVSARFENDTNRSFGWVCIGYNVAGGSNAVAIYTVNGTLIGEASVPYNGTNRPASLRFGNSNSNVGGSFPTNHIWEDSIIIDISDNPEWPLLPGRNNRANVINVGTANIGNL